MSTEAEFDLTIDLNVKSTFFISQRVGRHMMDARRRPRSSTWRSQAGFIALPDEVGLLPVEGGGRAT